MTTPTVRSIVISRRAFTASLLASAALGIGAGELAAPLAASQAHPSAVAAKAPPGCAQFAVNVGHAFTVLGKLLEDAAKYPPLISQAADAGLAKNEGKLNAIAAKVEAITATVRTQANDFDALKNPIFKDENRCLG